MKLVSMEKSQQEMKLEYAQPEPSKYPYGLKICLDTESIEKLGIKDLPEIGKTMKIECVVEVCGISMHESENHECKSIDLQIVEMGIEGKKSDPAKKLYGEG